MTHPNVPTTPDVSLLPSDGQLTLCWLPLSCQHKQCASQPPLIPLSAFFGGRQYGVREQPCSYPTLGMWVSLGVARAGAGQDLMHFVLSICKAYNLWNTTKQTFDNIVHCLLVPILTVSIFTFLPFFFLQLCLNSPWCYTGGWH